MSYRNYSTKKGAAEQIIGSVIVTLLPFMEWKAYRDASKIPPEIKPDNLESTTKELLFITIIGAVLLSGGCITVFLGKIWAFSITNSWTSDDFLIIERGILTTSLTSQTLAALLHRPKKLFVNGS